MPVGKRIIVAGISGVNVKGSLNKFIAHCNSKGKSVERRSINDYIHDLARKENEKITWLDILRYPYGKLISLWNEAMLIMQEEINKEPEKDFILAIHSCYYHQSTAEFISFANLDKLREFNTEKHLITFIDDIDDIQMRLKQPREIFSSEKAGAEETDIGNFYELLKILDWRANETLLSRFYASQLGIEHFLFAVKHPCDTLFKILYDEQDPKNQKHLKIYLSHPISKVRRLLFEKNFPEAQKEIEPITKLTQFLSDKSICFFPTTIDEYRINADQIDIKYSQRWEESIYLEDRPELLHVTIQDGKHLPYCENAITTFLTPTSTNLPEQSEIEKDLLKYKLHHLSQNFLASVLRQIGIRDKILVEQSEALFVYRPYLQGRISDGVEDEIHYMEKLNETSKGKLGIIYFPKEDIEDTKTRLIMEGFPIFIRDSEVFLLEKANVASCQEIVVENFKRASPTTFQDVATLAALIETITRDLVKKKIINKNPDYKEGALSEQLASEVQTLNEGFARKLIGGFTSQISKLNDRFIVYDDFFKTESIIDEFIKLKN